MRISSCLLFAMIAAGFGLVSTPSTAIAQELGSGLTAPQALPDAPLAQFAQAETPGQQAPTEQTAPAAQDSAKPPVAEKSQHEKAEEQIKEQEKQRMLGILPLFGTVYRGDAVSLSASQKMNLAFRSSIDVFTFGKAFAVAGLSEALGSDKGFGWGAEGYGKRVGAAYLDDFDGAMIGSGILPSVLHQDPRYFRMGHGAISRRILFAMATTVICKHDNTGKWEPNYSSVLGNLAAGGLSYFYYPSGDSAVSRTFSTGLVVTAEGGLGSLLQEFWPDVSRKLFHSDPTHGLDDQARAVDKAKKDASPPAK